MFQCSASSSTAWQANTVEVSSHLTWPSSPSLYFGIFHMDSNKSVMFWLQQQQEKWMIVDAELADFVIVKCSLQSCIKIDLWSSDKIQQSIGWVTKVGGGASCQISNRRDYKYSVVQFSPQISPKWGFLCLLQLQCSGWRHYVFGVHASVRVCGHPCMDFEHRYLWNRWRYRQVVNGIINYNLSRVEQKKFVIFGPLTMTVSWLMFIHHQSTLRVSRQRLQAIIQ